MPVKSCIRLKMNPRFDHRLAIALRRKRDFDCGQNFCIGQRQRVDIQGIQIVNVNGLHAVLSAQAAARGYS